MKIWLLVSLMVIFPLALQKILAKDLEKYTQEHFDIIYSRLDALNYQSSALLDIKREVSELRSKNRTLLDNIEVLERKVLKLEKQNKTEAAGVAKSRYSIPRPGSANSSALENDSKKLTQAKVLLRNKANKQAVAILEPLTASSDKEISLESQYWLGVAYVTQKDCARARPYLQSFYNSAPHHEFAPEAILASAICERQVGNNKAYKAAIAKIKNNYPQSRVAKTLP